MGNTLFSENQSVGLGGDFAAIYQGANWGTGPSKSQSFSNDGAVAIKPKVLKVAAYCRVSSLHNEQEDSLENQSVHYTRYIRSNPQWRMAGIYTDFGKSGTMISGRSGFNRLIRHAMQGKIDLILCKSVSRFARNVLDTLDKVRLLKEKGVRIIFDKEDIDTASMQSEFILTMMAAVAQEESRSISENVIWAFTKRFERGEPHYSRFLGYVQDENKNWVIQQEEAQIVNEAFDLCLKGHSPPQIARLFVRKGYETTKGRKEWSGTAVRNILRNVSYVGDVILQKTYTKDHLYHKTKINKGAKQQYLIQNHHEPIVDRITFDRAQEMLMRRRKPRDEGRKKSYPLSSRIVCGECGGNLQRFICRGVVTWRCGKRTKSQMLCKMGGVKEDNILLAIRLAVQEKYSFQESEVTQIYSPVQAMLKDLKNAEISSDIEYNQLRLELERILYEENMAIIKSAATDKRDQLDVTVLKEKRLCIERKLQEREVRWGLLEADFDYRNMAMKKLEPFSKRKTQVSELEAELQKTEFLRAWVVRVKALSPISFAITWVKGEVIEVELAEGGAD